MLFACLAVRLGVSFDAFDGVTKEKDGFTNITTIEALHSIVVQRGNAAGHVGDERDRRLIPSSGVCFVDL